MSQSQNPPKKIESTIAKEEAKEIFKLPMKERGRYILVAYIGSSKEYLNYIRGNGIGGSVSLSFFTPNAKEAPDFDHIEVIDCGQTIRFGNYEVATDAILAEEERVFNSPPGTY